jgi:hypothetical protein
MDQNGMMNQMPGMGVQPVQQPYTMQPMQQPYAQPMQPVQQSYQQPYAQPQQVPNNKPKKVNVNSGTITHTGNQLFEIQGAVDITDRFPEGIGFVMLVPSVEDKSKQSGRTYVMNEKIIMKFSSEELHTLAEAILEGSTYGACSYTKFSDPKKAGNQGETKKLQVTAIIEGNKTKVFIAISWGQKKVSMPLEKYTAKGVAWQIHDLATRINNMKFDQELKNRENYQASQPVTMVAGVGTYSQQQVQPSYQIAPQGY